MTATAARPTTPVPPVTSTFIAEIPPDYRRPVRTSTVCTHRGAVWVPIESVIT